MTVRTFLGSTKACIGLGFVLGATAMLGFAEPTRVGSPVPAPIMAGAR